MNRLLKILLAIALLFAPSAIAANKTRVNPINGLTYVWIPPGTYWTGCLKDDKNCIGWERKRAEITITAGFWIGQTEVTQSAYQKVMRANPSHYRGPDLPVDSVSWPNAMAYCKRIGMRLPTESEWEYAAYGGAEHLPKVPLSALAWYDPNSNGKTHLIAQKLPNGYGLYDMLGNVWEWVSDVGTSPEGRILKGGSFYNSARDIRVADRLGAPETLNHRDIGFRCVGDKW